MRKVLLFILVVCCFVQEASAQNATFSVPVSIGRNNCGSGSKDSVYYFNYASQNLTNGGGTIYPGCKPILKNYAPVTGYSTKPFTIFDASIAFNPKDQMLYYVWTDYKVAAPYKSYIWRWLPSACPTAAAGLDTVRTFSTDIGGITFDPSGVAYQLEFDASVPHKAFLRTVDFTSGTTGTRDTLDLTGGKQLWTVGSGDITLTPSGQMYFVFDNKLFTPDYGSYGGATHHIKCTYIDTIKAPSTTTALPGLCFGNGDLIAAYSPSCTYRKIDGITGDTAAINYTYGGGLGVYSTDMTQINSGLGLSKKLISAVNTGTAGQYDITYDIYVRNYGNVPITNVQVSDNLSLINGLLNVSNVTATLISNPAGVALSGLYNGTVITNLMAANQTLNNYPVAQNNFTIRISCRISNLVAGIVYNNSAVGTASGYKGVALKDSSTNGSNPDLNQNDKPDDVGESQPTPFVIILTPTTPPCATLAQTLYSQTFGAGTGLVNTVNNGAITASSAYVGVTAAPVAINRFTVTNNANNGNTTDWISLTDHTGDANGRMMLVNADASASVMYRDTLPVSCPGQQYSVSLWAAYLNNAASKLVCDGLGGIRYPLLTMRIRDLTTGLTITQFTTDSIKTNTWQQLGMKWVMPSGYTNVILEILNAGGGGCGNDVGIDDITYGICDPLPTVSVSNSGVACLGSSVTFTANLSDPTVVPGTKDYQWQWSPAPGTGPWTNITGATSSTYTINPVTITDTGRYYRVIVAAAGNIGIATCQYISPGTKLSGVKPSVAPTSITVSAATICSGSSVTLTAVGATLGTGANYQWGTGSTVGVSPIVGATSSTLTVSPTSTTTYWVEVENTTTPCASASGGVTTTITVNQPSTAPTSITGLDICNGSSTTLTANGGILGTGATYQWGTGAVVGTNPIAGATASTLTVSPTTTTTYWVRIIGTTAPCTTNTGGVTKVVTVSQPSTAPTSINVSPASVVCYPTSVTLTAVGGVLGTGANYQWGTGSVVGTNPIAGATSNTLTVTPTTTTTYWVRIENTASPCTAITGGVTTTITVNQPSTAPTSITGANICNGSSTTLTAVGGTLGTGANYQWGTGAVIGTSPIAGATGVTLTVSPTTTTTYWVRIENSAAPCTATTGGATKVITVSQPSTAPTSISVPATTICNPTTTTLTAVGGVLGTGANYQWGTGSVVGTNPIAGATSNTLTVTPTTTTTYWVRIENTASPCTAITGGTTVTITVNQPSTAPTSITGADICNGSSTTLTAVGGVLGTGANYQWGTGSVVGTNPIAGATGVTLTVSPTTTTTYWVRIENNTAPCPGNTGGVTKVITVSQPSTAPTSITGLDICNGSSTTLTAIGGVLGTGANYQWGTGSVVGTNPIAGATGVTLTVSPTTTTTYWVRIENNAAPCPATTTGATKVITVTQPSTAPTSISVPATTICNPTTTTLTAVGGILGTGANYQWGTGSVVGTNPIAGATSNTLTVTPTTTTTYWVRIENTASPCTAITGGTTVTITVNQPSTAPTSITGADICNGSSTTLTAIGGVLGTGANYQWGTGSVVGSNPIAGATGVTLTVSPTTTTTYWVRIENNAAPCLGNTGGVTKVITVSQPSTAPTSITGLDICNGSSTTLTAVGGVLGTGANYQWGTGSVVGTNPIAGATGITLTVSPTTTTTYWVRIENNAAPCPATTGGVTKVITVSNSSTAPTSITGADICNGSSTTLTAVGGVLGTGANYQWGTGSVVGTNPIAGATGVTLTVSPTTTTTYWVRIENNAAPCPATTGGVTKVITVSQPSTAPTSITGADICNGSSTTLTAIGGVLGTGANYQWGTGSVVGTNPIVGATGVTLTVSPTTTTTYWVRIENNAAPCPATTGGVTKVITVSNSSTAPTSITGADICNGSSTTLTAIGGVLGTGANYQWGTGSVVGTNPIAGATGVTLTVSPTSTTTYWVRIENNAAPCPATTGGVTKVITVSQPSTAPTSITGADICNGSSTTLTAIGGVLGTGANYQWGTGAVVGTNPIAGATGVTLTVSPTTTTTYWVRIENNAAPCPATTTGAIKVITVTQPSTAPTSISVPATTICNPTTTTLTAVGGVLGTGANYQWGTGSVVGTNPIAGATGNTLTVTPTITTTYWVRIENTASPCTATTGGTTVTITVNQPSTAPTSITGADICNGSSTTLTANGGVLGTGANYQWGIGAVIGTNPIAGATSATLTVSPTSTTTYWVRIENNAGPCPGTTGGVTKVITVSNSSTAPTSITGADVCNGSSTTLTAIGGVLGTGANYQWGTGSVVGTNPIVGATGITLTVSPTTTTTYWVRIENNAAPCPATTTGVTKVITVSNPSTAPTSITGADICNGSSTTLTAIGGVLGTGANYQWGTGSVVGSNPIAGATGVTLTVSPTSTTTYWVRIENNAAPCPTTTTGVTKVITVSNPSTAPTSITGADICNGSSTTLTAIGGVLGTGANYQWGTGSVVGTNPIAGATGITLTVSPTSTTTYWVRIENNAAPCPATTGGVTKVITVSNSSTAPTSITGADICNGSSTTLTAIGGVLGTGANYQWGTGSVVGTNPIAGATGVTLTVSPTSTTTYWVRIENNAAPCPATTTGATKLITVTQPSTAPTSITAPATTICNGSSVTLTANGGVLGTGANYQWGTGSVVGTNPIAGATSNTLTVSPSATTTYWVRIENTASPCTAITGGVTTTITVNQSSTAPTSITGADICNGSSTTLTAIGGVLGTSANYQWGTGAVVGTNPIAGATGATLTVSPTSTTTYWVRIENNAAPCTATTGGVTKVITVTQPSTAPTSITAPATTICNGSSVTLTANGGVLGTGANYQWGTGSVVGTNPIVGATGSTLTVTPGATTTYWVRIENTASPCTATTGGTTVTITVNSSSTAPASITGADICNGSSTTLTANGGVLGTGANYQWGTGTVVGTSPIVGATSASLTVSPTTSTTYWVRIENNAAPCTGNTAGVTKLITVRQPSTAPTSITSPSASICSGSSVTLTAAGGTLGTGANYQWGTGAVVGVSPIAGATSSTYTVSPTSTTTYWVRIENTTSPCSATTGGATTTITVNSPSTAPSSITGNDICNGSSVTLTANGGVLGTGANYQWGTGTVVGTSPIAGATAATLTVSPTTTTTYWVRIQNTTAPCTGNTGGVTKLITVRQPSVSPTSITSPSTSICSGSSVTLTAAGGTLGTGANYQWGTGAVVGVSPIAGATSSTYTVSPTSTTTYWVRIENTTSPCSAITGGATTTITVNSPSTAPSSITGLDIPCGSTTTTLTANGGVLGTGANYQWGIGSVVGTNPIAGATGATLTVSPTVTTTYWVRIQNTIAPCTGNTGGVTKVVTVTSSSVAASAATKNRNNICPGISVQLGVTGGFLGTNANWKWYTGSCGGTLVGTGSSLTVTPLVTTTYYVRAEGDCNTTACVQVTVFISCDIDKDKDGIPDLVESNMPLAFADANGNGIINAYDPTYPGFVDNNNDYINDNFQADGDSDGDGIPNYLDIDFPGRVDVNGDGIDDRFDADLDGKINMLDLDSDNDGIPDVVEAYGVDVNGDGLIDNFTDTDGDGLSQNVDANNTGAYNTGLGLGRIDLDGDGLPNFLDVDSDNDGIPDLVEVGGADVNNDGRVDVFVDNDGDGWADAYEGTSKALLRTGSDANNDGKADSFPYKNMDGDAKPNPYDMDSDGDGIVDVIENGLPDANLNGIVDGTIGSNGWSTTVSSMPSLTMIDTDGDGKPDYLDIDSDNDGATDNIEGQTTLGYKLPTAVDTDGDGLANVYDQTVGFGGGGVYPVDTDGDGIPDYLDQDSDSDGVIDRIEANDFNFNRLPDDNVTLTGVDTDGDGLDDRFDLDNTSAKGTSSNMGNGGSQTGATSPGTRSVVQKSWVFYPDRDWRYVGFVLPVQFLKFSGVPQGNNVQLSWTIIADKAVDHFEIERSIDNATYTKTETVSDPVALQVEQNFGTVDNISAVSSDIIYYRLKVIGKAGEIKYSNILVVRRSLVKTPVTIQPNPANNYVAIHFFADKDQEVTVRMIDNAGKLIFVEKQKALKGNNTLSMNNLTKYSNGVYSLQILVNNEIVTEKLVLAR